MVANFKKNKKHNAKKNILLHIGGVVVLLILIGLIVANVKLYRKRQEYLAQVANLETQIQNIKNKNNSLNQEISNSDNNQYIEKVAREELDLQKPGEQAVSFVMPEPLPHQTSTPKQHFLQNWLNGIKGFFW